MAAAGDAAKVVLIDRDYKAKETPATRCRRVPCRVTNRKAGLKATLHSLRHTHASTLIASGLNVLTISRRLGHGSPAITLGIYGHLFKTDDRAAAIMEAALAGTE